jgi:hypothetical protein
LRTALRDARPNPNALGSAFDIVTRSVSARFKNADGNRSAVWVSLPAGVLRFIRATSTVAERTTFVVDGQRIAWV